MFLIQNIFGQQSIVFKEISLQDALEQAKSSNKNIFIDTYADWCIPCKQMETQFIIPKVAKFFNESYINIRINIEKSSFADQYRKAYDVVFLPTMIILDKYGNVKYKTDRYMDGLQLLDVATKTLQENVYFLSEAAEIVRNPMGGNTTSNRSGSEVVVHKLGAPNSNPDMLRKEAYFRIELMDGSHKVAAENFLNTQKNWHTKSNMQFILDFVQDTKSKHFNFFAENIGAFKDTFGVENINRTLTFLLEDELAYSFPRPSFEKIFFLQSLINASDAEKQTYMYFVDRYLAECNLKELYKLYKKYDIKYSLDNDFYYGLIGSICIENQVQFASLEDCISSLQNAIKQDITIPNYHHDLAILYSKLGDKKLALTSVNKAINTAKMLNHNLTPHQKLKNSINKM